MRTGQRQRAPGEPGHDGGGQHADARVQAAAPRASGRLDGERQQRKEPERREQPVRARRAARRARRATSAASHAEGERAVRPPPPPARRCRAGTPARRARSRARAAAPEASPARRPATAGRGRAAARTAAARRRRPSRPPPGRRAGAGARAGSRGRGGTRPRRRRDVRREVGRSLRRCVGLGAATNASRSSVASCDAVGRRLGSTSSALSTAASRRRGRSPRRAESGGAPAAIADATSGSGTPQNGWVPASASQSITPTAQTSLATVASAPPSRSGEMYASVPGTSPTAVSVSASSNCASPKSRTRTATSSDSSRSTFDGLTSRCTMPRRCACARPSRTCAAASTAAASLELVPPDRLPERLAPDVLVRDVDVAVVAGEVVGADAALVAQARGRLHLAHRARGALALARDDLQRDLETGPLVAREPDGAGAATAERSERPVAVEDERSVGEGVGSGRHRSTPLRRERGTSFARESPVDSAGSGVRRPPGLVERPTPR